MASLLALLASAPAAQARYDSIAAGTTRLVLKQSFESFLKRNGLRISTSGSARLKRGVVRLPVSGGKVDPTSGRGTIEQEGVISFVGSRQVPLRDLVLKTGHSPLIAKVGGGQLKVATSPRLDLRRDGFSTRLTAGPLQLTAKIVSRLNKKLRPPVPFAAGQTIGEVVSVAEPATTKTLEKNRVELAFAPAMVAKLEGLFVSLNPISPAERAIGTGSALFTLPITAEGDIAPSGRGGTLRSAGAIELLQLHAGQVFWRELSFDLGDGVVGADVDIEPTPAYPGKLGPIPVFDLDLSGASIAPMPKARTVAVSGARLSLQPSTATYLNQAFAEGKDDFKAGEEVGTVSFLAQGQ